MYAQKAFIKYLLYPQLSHPTIAIQNYSRFTNLAKIAPAILCQTLNIAPGTADKGIVAKCVCASVQASPEFCIPTSTDIATPLACERLSIRESMYPNENPHMLCNATIRITIRPAFRKCSALLATTEPTIRAITIDENAGKYFDALSACLLK